MSLEDDLKAEVDTIFGSQWSTRDGYVVPDETSITLGNDGVRIDATVLYADLSDSTQLVDAYPDWFAAEIYKTFLRCASRIIRSQGGSITSFDGDRVMAVYMGEGKEKRAAWTGLGINRAMLEIIRPTLRARYPQDTYIPQHTVGIDNSQILVVKEGVRGDNDLLWIGRAANYAAKLCTLSHNWQIYITPAIRAHMLGPLATTNTGTPVWELARWAEMGNAEIYRSSCIATAL